MNRTLVSVAGRIGRSATHPIRRVVRPVGVITFVLALLLPATPVFAATASYTLTVPTTVTAGTTFVASFAKSGAPAGAYHTWSVSGGTKVSGCTTNAATCTVRPNKIATYVSATGKVTTATGTVAVAVNIRRSTGTLITSRSVSRKSGNPLIASTVTRSASTILGGRNVTLATVPSGAGPWTYTTAGAYFTFASGSTKTSQSPIVKMASLANVATATRTITHVIKDASGNSISFALPIGVTNSTSGSTVSLTSGGEPLTTSGAAGQGFVADLTIAPATGGHPFSYKVTRTKVSITGAIQTGAVTVASGTVESPDTGAAISLTLPTTLGFYSYAFTAIDASGNSWTRKAATIQVGQASAFVTAIDSATGAPVSDASLFGVCRLIGESCDPDFWMVNDGGVPAAGFVQDLAPGNYHFFVFGSPTHANSAAVPVTIVAGQRVPVVISMAPATVTSFSGTVTDGTGSPLANVRVNLSGPSLGSGSVLTDEAGRYVFMNRPAGDYEISVYLETDIGDGRASAEVAYDGTASVNQDLEVTIVPYE
jgi:hypothetical protein